MPDIAKVLETFGESVHLSALVFRQIAKFQDLSRRVVAFEAIVEVANRVFCALVCRLFNIAVSFGKAINPRVEHFDAGFRTRHDAAQKGERRPILHSLLSGASRVGHHEFAGEFQDVAEKGRVFAGEVIRPLECVAQREVRILIHPLCDVRSLALNEVTSEIATLRLRCVRKVEEFEFGSQQAKDRLKFFRLSTVWGCCKHHQVLTWLCGDTADEMVALLLSR